MARKNKDYFFGNTSNKLLKDGDKPNQQTFEDLLDSSTFPTELEDRAKRTEAGLVKTTTDVKVNQCDDKDEEGVSPCGFPTFTKPSQIPKLLAGTCINLQRVNRATGTVPNVYSLDVQIAACEVSVGAHSAYVFHIIGIEASLVQELRFNANGSPFIVKSFTNIGGVIATTVQQAVTSIVWGFEVELASGIVYTITFTVTQSGVDTCDGVISNISVIAPPYSPDVNTEDGSNTEDWRISVNRECLDIPACATDLDWCIPNQTIKSVSFDNDPCEPADICNAAENDIALDENANLGATIQTILGANNDTASAVKAISDAVCQLQADLAQVTGGDGTAAGILEVGDMVMTFEPPNTWPSHFIEADGVARNIADFPSLAAKWGTTYGGDGVTTFGVPLITANTFLSVTKGSDTGNSILNATGGTNSVTLAANNLPEHDHSIPTLTGETSLDGGHSHDINTDTTPDATLIHDDPSGPEVAAGSVSSTTFPGTASTQPNTGAHQHNLTTYPNTTGLGGGQASPDSFDIIPPYREVYLKIRAK